MANPRALIIDDEPDILELLELTLSRMDVEVEKADDVASAKRALASHDFDLCFTDMRLPDGDGIEIVRHISAENPQLPVAVITAHGNMEAAVEALKAGAFDFVSKPVDLSVLRSLVGTALRVKAPAAASEAEVSPPADGALRMLGESVVMERVRGTVAKLARSQAPVYISGESGVGKELAARMIHEQGPRADGPFVPVNCGAIPTELMESEFFGHKKGSFTGAHADKEGLFQAADGGTLFLDEVADLPLHMQVKLLRVIQEKAVRPIGARAEVHVDVRILSATHKDLARLVEDGLFRQDLFYRINVIELRMPGLRDRPEDVPELAEFLLRRIANTWEIKPPVIDGDAMLALQDYSFPGNVRELENVLERAMTLCEDDVIRQDDLQLSERAASANGNGVALSAPTEGPPGNMGLEEYIDDVERSAITKALEETRYNKTAAAKKLGITFRALRYRLKKLEME